MNSTPFIRRLAFTPLRDLLRLNISGRLDARSHIESLDLPDEAKQLIDRIVIRTRLWRNEKIDVADELASHFREGLASGRSMRDLIERFGDERAAAQLIRRAKRRERSWFWHLRHRAMQTTGVLIVVYAGLIAYFLSGKAVIKVDYVAKLNAPVLATPEDQRAWPAYRDALAQMGFEMNGQDFEGPDSRFDRLSAAPGDEHWRAGIEMRSTFRSSLDRLYAASGRPDLGFLLERPSSGPDPLAGSLYTLEYPPLRHLRGLLRMFYADGLDAVIAGDSSGVIRAAQAIEGVSQQLRSSPLLLSHLVGVAGRGMTLDLIGKALLNQQDQPFLNDHDLLDLDGIISRYDTSADLADFVGERMFFDDLVQRIYTDDGTGDGRLASDGLGNWASLQGIERPSSSSTTERLVLALGGPIGLAVMPGRRELTDVYASMITRLEASRRQRWTLDKLRSHLDDESAPPDGRLGSVGTALITTLVPSFRRIELTTTNLLTQRDGMRAAIALERYRLAHGRFPESLHQLVPSFLPTVPMDPVDGQPLRYRVTDDVPVVYSLGIDRDDDGGRPSARRSAANIGGDLDNPPDADWVLFPNEGL